MDKLPIICRFHLCLWYKDDSQSRENVAYHLARLKSRAILRDSTGSLFLSRDGAKRICLALGQNVSFARGFDKILYLLLVTSLFYLSHLYSMLLSILMDHNTNFILR